MAAGVAYPNLKITVGNDEISLDEESVEEGELEEKNEYSGNETKDVQIQRKFVSPLDRSRIYENKIGAFITGVDLTSESIQKKLIDRAARFGMQETFNRTITQENIDALYKSLGVDIDQAKQPSSKTRQIRLDSIHMRGVEEMSTSEVVNYFKEYGPASMEWINDYSCNVVWLDNEGAARALLGLSKVLVVKKKNKNSNNDDEVDTRKKENDNVSQDEKEEVIFMSDISSDSEDDAEEDDDDDKFVSFKHEKKGNPKKEEETAMEVDDAVEDSSKIDDKQKEESFNVDVPVPPGHWRLGIPHPKAKAILLRYATKDDRKLPGAERRSQYYQKYGNPNFGGLKGLITRTKKRKFLVTKQRQVVEHLSGKDKSPPTGLSSEIQDETVENRRRKPKKLRMRMCADDEEERLEKLKRKSFRRHLLEDRVTLKRRKIVEDLPSNRRNVYERLGSYTGRDEFCEDHSSDDDPYLANVKSEVSKPGTDANKFSRFNVWTKLAESMAKDSDDPERGYRTKRRGGEDLRDKLQSQKSSHQRTDSTVVDLRSKLDRLRKSEDASSKHRSPLLIDDET